RSEEVRDCVRWPRPRRRKTPDRDSGAALRTIGRRGDILRLPRLRTEREDSRLAEFGFGAASNVIPRDTGRLAAQNATGAPLDFCSPRGLDFRRIIGFRIIETRQQFGGNVSAVRDRQSESLTEKFLGSGRHDTFYIDSSV